MGRASDIEAFARLLDGAPASEVPSSVAALGHTVSALQGIPAPVLPASQSHAGGVALLARATTNGPKIAGTGRVAPHGTQLASPQNATGAKAAAGASKLAAAKASLFGVLTAHLAPVVAGTAALAVGVTGVAVGASRSLPGDPLYGLKRATESVRSATTTTKVSAAERQLTLATTRLHEALALQSRGGSAKHLAAELQDWMTDETSALAVLGPLAGTPAIKAKLTAFAAENGAGLTAFPAATVASMSAAVQRINALVATRPPAPPTLGTTRKTRPLTVPSIVVRPSQPAVTTPATHSPVHLPSALPTDAVNRPKASGNVPTALPTAPAAGLPSAATVIPSSLPTTVLPSALPSIPGPTVSDVTTLLQGLNPQH